MADTLIQGTTIIEDKRKADGEIWSCKARNFQTSNPTTPDVGYDQFGNVAILTGTEILLAPVNLPNGVTITKVVSYGSEADESWTLYRGLLNADNYDAMASAAMNTEDSSISNSKVDNNTYGYWIATSSLDTGDKVYGARIIYEF